MTRKRKKKGGGKVAVAPRENEAPKTEAQPTESRTAYDSFRENAEALVVAILLAIIIRHFAVEAFEIPTGSMASTLYGMHAWFDCPNCDTEFNAGLSSDSSTGDVKVQYRPLTVYDGRCPDPACTLELHGYGREGRPLVPGMTIECQASGTVFEGRLDDYRRTEAIPGRLRCPICHLTWTAMVEKKNRSGGHKILVNKFVYQLGEPRRFDVIVFAFDQWKNYIKRLVGLPGERIHLIDGDLYVNGRIVRKPRAAPDVQEALWRKISDSDVRERGLNKQPAWREPAAKRVPAWKELADGRWSLNNPARKEPAILEYARPLDNYISYNILSHPGNGRHALVGDVKLEFTVRPTSGGGWIGAEIRDGNWTFQARIPVGTAEAGHPAVLERVANEPHEESRNPLKPRQGDTPPVERAGFALPAGDASRIELENSDDSVTLRVNGEAVLSLDYQSVPNVEDPPVAAGKLPHHYLWILGSGVQANVESIRVYQDIYYTQDARRWAGGIDLGPGEYWALGDNSPSSSDGRAWGYVPEKNLMGKALLVFWPLFQAKFIR